MWGAVSISFEAKCLGHCPTRPWENARDPLPRLPLNDSTTQDMSLRYPGGQFGFEERRDYPGTSTRTNFTSTRSASILESSTITRGVFGQRLHTWGTDPSFLGILYDLVSNPSDRRLEPRSKAVVRSWWMLYMLLSILTCIPTTGLCFSVHRRKRVGFSFASIEWPGIHYGVREA